MTLARPATGQKGSPAKRTGHTILVAAQYSQESLKNNVLFVDWLADFGAVRTESGAFGLLGRINPAQHFLEVIFHSLVAEAGPPA
jgi:hypothetical protein